MDEILPNYSTQATLATHSRRSSVARGWLERILNGRLATRLERWEMERKIRKFQAAYADSVESSFSSDWCKGHFHHHRQKTLDSYTARMETL
jgi:hypothetical protein